MWGHRGDVFLCTVASRPNLDGQPTADFPTSAFYLVQQTHLEECGKAGRKVKAR